MASEHVPHTDVAQPKKATIAEMMALRGRYDEATKSYRQADGSPGLTNVEIAAELKVSRGWVYDQIGAQPDAKPSKQLTNARAKLADALAMAKLRADAYFDIGIKASSSPGTEDDAVVGAYIIRRLDDAIARLSLVALTGCRERSES